MRGRPAKVLGRQDLRRVLAAIRRRANANRNEAIFLLSVKAGLRACEIARLRWENVTDGRGRVTSVMELPAKAAKRGSGRRIPLHPDLRAALEGLRRPGDREGVVVRSRRGGAMTADSIVNWFTALFAETRLQGCSSHSGRRTFITLAARQVAKVGGSLRDVQQLAGHRSIQTTQGYIDGNEAAQRRLVRLL
ncbi:MAG: tyrosine-type recombinase/integrase [Bauldia sp.]